MATELNECWGSFEENNLRSEKWPDVALLYFQLLFDKKKNQNKSECWVFQRIKVACFRMLYWFYSLIFVANVYSLDYFLYNLCRFLDVRQHSFVTEWKVTTSSVPGMSRTLVCFSSRDCVTTQIKAVRGGLRDWSIPSTLGNLSEEALDKHKGFKFSVALKL